MSFNAVALDVVAGLSWCEFGGNVEEQLLIGADTRQQEADASCVAQDHGADL